MTRTQILLEKWQYDELKRISRRERKSLSGTVRTLLSGILRAPRSETSRRRIVGLFNDKAGSGRDHDDVLYSRAKDK